MEFLYPGFLLGLLALAVPIIIHLYYFRRFKKVYFTNVKFLREIKEETSSRSKLRNLLVLLMRCLAIAFLVFAFAQPIINQGRNVVKGTKEVSIYVDNSFSMDALSEDINLLQLAKKRAKEIINSFGSGDKFQVITNDFEGRHQRLISQEDAISYVEEIKSTPIVRSISKVLGRQKQVYKASDPENKISFLIGDLQKSSFDIEGWRDTSFQINVLPLYSVQQKNISIDTAYFIAPIQVRNQANPIVVEVTNYSNIEVKNARISVDYQGQIKPIGTVDIPALSTVIDTVNLSVIQAGFHQATIEVTDFPIQFDDQYHISFEVKSEIDVLVVNDLESNTYLNAAIEGLPYFVLQQSNALGVDFSGISKNKLIVLNELNSISSGMSFELRQYIENGGNVLIFPSTVASKESYNHLLGSVQANTIQSGVSEKREVGSLNTDDFVFKNVFSDRNKRISLPTTQFSFEFSNFSSNASQSLLRYRNGSPFMLKYQFGLGNLFVCAAPLSIEYNDLVKHGEIFVPMLYKMAISSNENKKVAYTIGLDLGMRMNNISSKTESVLKLVHHTKELIPQQNRIGSQVYIGFNDGVSEAGFYSLIHSDGEEVNLFAFNYDRKESILDYYNKEEIEEYVTEKAQKNVKLLNVNPKSDLSEIIKAETLGISLWKWCVVGSLFFLLFESLILRFWNN